jgi:hypothetical protein
VEVGQGGKCVALEHAMYRCISFSVLDKGAGVGLVPLFVQRPLGSGQPVFRSSALDVSEPAESTTEQTGDAQQLCSNAMIQQFTRVVSKFNLSLNQAAYMFNVLLPKLEMALHAHEAPLVRRHCQRTLLPCLAATATTVTSRVTTRTRALGSVAEPSGTAVIQPTAVCSLGRTEQTAWGRTAAFRFGLHPDSRVPHRKATAKLI